MQRSTGRPRRRGTPRTRDRRSCRRSTVTTAAPEAFTARSTPASRARPSPTAGGLDHSPPGTRSESTRSPVRTVVVYTSVCTSAASTARAPRQDTRGSPWAGSCGSPGAGDRQPCRWGSLRAPTPPSRFPPGQPRPRNRQPILIQTLRDRRRLVHRPGTHRSRRARHGILRARDSGPSPSGWPSSPGWSSPPRGTGLALLLRRARRAIPLTTHGDEKEHADRDRDSKPVPCTHPRGPQRLPGAFLTPVEPTARIETAGVSEYSCSAWRISLSSPASPDTKR